MNFLTKLSTNNPRHKIFFTTVNTEGAKKYTHILREVLYIMCMQFLASPVFMNGRFCTQYAKRGWVIRNCKEYQDSNFFFPFYVMKACIRIEVWLHSFFSREVVGNAWFISRFGCLATVKDSVYPLDPESFRQFRRREILHLPGFDPQDSRFS